jgi:hypothetical protein
MAKRSRLLASATLGVVLVALALRATTVHSVNAVPLIYRALVRGNDLDFVEGLAPPGQVVELWARQRNFVEGADSGSDVFSWCRWKNNGTPVFLGVAQANANGVWNLGNLSHTGNTMMIFPPAPGADRCLGGLFTELLPRTCDGAGNCTAWNVPTLHFLNVNKLTPIIAAMSGAVSDAEQTSAAVADGPNDGPEASDVVDVDQNAIDTTKPGLVVGQRVSWRCGAGGTSVCPSITVHDASTAIAPDPEYPFVLGTIQAHRPGGSFLAAAAIPRGQPIGFAVNVNVRFRGNLDLNVGCDQRRSFDFFN